MAKRRWWQVRQLKQIEVAHAHLELYLDLIGEYPCTDDKCICTDKKNCGILQPYGLLSRYIKPSKITPTIGIMARFCNIIDALKYAQSIKNHLKVNLYISDGFHILAGKIPD